MTALRDLINMWREQALRCGLDATAADVKRAEINAQMGDAPTPDAVRELGAQAMEQLADAGLDRAMSRVLAICADQLESHLAIIERAG